MTDGGEVIIFAPHITDVSIMHPQIAEVGHRNRDYFGRPVGAVLEQPWGDLADSTHRRGQGTWDLERGERNRLTRDPGRRILEDLVRAVNLNDLDPSAVDVAAYQADPDILRRTRR